MLSISFVGCLDELDEPSPEPPTEEFSLDGGLYVPSAPETSSPYGEGAGSGSGSGAMSAPDHQRIEEKGASPSEAEEDLLLDDVCVQDAVNFEEVEYE